MSETYPVTVAVTGSDGSVEQVRVGTATRTQEGFSITFGSLRIESKADAPAARRAAPAARALGGDASGMVFPPYGRSKGMPVAGASMQDLEFYANGCRRTLGDPGKARWHDKEKVLLAAIETEIARQQGGGSGDMPDDSHIPPPNDDDAPF
jgi:hypothetical protein